MKRILLPLQGFAAEVHAASLAFCLAEVSKATVVGMHCKEDEDEAQTSSLEQLMGHAKSLSASTSVSFEIKEACKERPTDAILDIVGKEKIDLIVMSAARDRLHRQLLGSVSRDVVRKGKTPTILVASWLEDFKQGSGPIFHKVLVPVANLAEDIAALRLGAALAKGTIARDAELIVFNATILPAILPMTATDLPEFRRAKEKFHQSVEKVVHETGIKLTVKHTPARSAEQAIIEVAEKEEFDIIILGGLRRPGAFGAFLDATSFKVATKARAAVVLIYA